MMIMDGDLHPITCHKGPEGEQGYSSTLPLTSALDGGLRSTPFHEHKPGVKFTLEQAMKAQRGSRGIALFFL